jgi:phosphoglycolate phosphatase
VSGGVFFDLDGTLTDSKEGITNSVRYALRKLGLVEPDRDWLVRFIGPPLADSFKAYCGLDQASAERAVGHYREYFSEQGIFENRLYSGVPDLLEEGLAAGRAQLLVTSKPTVYAEKILHHFEIDHCFGWVVGSRLDGTRVGKTELVAEGLLRLRREERCKVVMVGDREHDVRGARANGIDSIAVTYGYAQPGEIERARPTRTARTVDDLRRLLCTPR